MGNTAHSTLKLTRESGNSPYGELKNRQIQNAVPCDNHWFSMVNFFVLSPTLMLPEPSYWLVPHFVVLFLYANDYSSTFQFYGPHIVWLGLDYSPWETLYFRLYICFFIKSAGIDHSFLLLNSRIEIWSSIRFEAVTWIWYQQGFPSKYFWLVP